AAGWRCPARTRAGRRAAGPGRSADEWPFGRRTANALRLRQTSPWEQVMRTLWRRPVIWPPACFITPRWAAGLLPSDRLSPHFAGEPSRGRPHALAPPVPQSIPGHHGDAIPAGGV